MTVPASRHLSPAPEPTLYSLPPPPAVSSVDPDNSAAFDASFAADSAIPIVIDNGAPPHRAVHVRR